MSSIDPARVRPPAAVGERRLLVLLAGLGALAGAAAKAADESPWRWAADLGTLPAAWVLAVALLARGAGSARAAAVRSAVFFCAMTVAYYSWAAGVLDFGWSVQLPLWLLLSVTAVPAFGVTVWTATRRAGALPGLLLAFAGAVTLARGAVGRLWAQALSEQLGTRPVQLLADVLVAGFVVLVLPGHRSTRRWAVAALVPLTLLVRLALDARG
ncbi:hypothetical protein GB931_19420 [Modestobacter sp. I12A-02628]|uniref:Apolipoprotein N-acyltransferase n=1 Tax=Goekera deserti TaxID=2497753 RepID=A0A7K3WFC6_9ACTN|nr:hypothetical protein [Goekera deserti]MPR00050.1 hypothetical protein [Goekera deserti]NDI49829.1 hypothetical protein [Goekera deserti]NEL55191.1 hypothetical protein [Goekera deserti]